MSWTPGSGRLGTVMYPCSWLLYCARFLCIWVYFELYFQHEVQTCAYLSMCAHWVILHTHHANKTQRATFPSHALAIPSTPCLHRRLPVQRFASADCTQNQKVKNCIRFLSALPRCCSSCHCMLLARAAVYVCGEAVLRVGVSVRPCGGRCFLARKDRCPSPRRRGD